MGTSALHEQSIVIDGLIIARFSRSVFEDMRRGGLTAANCTCSVWENFDQSMRNIIEWNRFFRKNDDILMQVHKSDDVLEAKRQGKVGIVLGWQNTSGIEDQLGYLEIFKRLGVHVMQLTYNTQNLSGSGCRESRDSGLSDFGREVIDEMNRVGILCDLSHVGTRTSEEAILHSKMPVTFSHCCPAALLQHPRNKSDEQIRMVADRGGLIGITAFPWFLPKGGDSTIDDYVEAIEYVVNVAGEEHVGFGTDSIQDQPPEHENWLIHDKGYARKLFEPGEVAFPEGFRTIGDTPNLTDAMLRRGWKESLVERVMGGNWLQLFKTVWKE